MAFSAHGNIDFVIQNQSVINRPNSSFNAGGIDMLFDQILKKTQELDLKEWILIELLGSNAIPTPEALTALIDRYKEAKALGCKKVFVVCSISMQRPFMQELGEKSGLPMQFYDSEEEVMEINQAYL